MGDPFQELLTISTVPVDGTSEANIVSAFAAISRPKEAAIAKEHIHSAITRHRLTQLDLFTLRLLIDSRARETRPARQNITALVDDYCRAYLAKAFKAVAARESVMNRAARLAFMYEVNAEDISTESDEDRIAWELVRKHSQISNYLAARYIVSEITRVRKFRGRGRDLRYVYPYRINRFSKELVNRDEKVQREVFAGIKAILRYKSAHRYARAHACYLAGRLELPQLREQAAQELRRYLEQLPRDGERTEGPDKIDLLLRRTIFISLAYLGDAAAQEEYVNELLANGEWDRFNRGFHLEYYGDQVYTPSEALLSDDALEPCPRTFEQLFGRLSRFESNPLFEVEVQTLFSLAQHRHAAGRLQPSDRQRLDEFALELIKSRRLRNPTLRTYISMVHKHLAHDHFRIGKVFDEFYEIKRVLRSGWRTRGVEHAESVADHTYGAYLIALFLLPDAAGDYSKEHIIRMLLIHDLAEAIIGDFLPEDRNELTNKKEREVYEEIAMLGTYHEPVHQT